MARHRLFDEKIGYVSTLPHSEAFCRIVYNGE